MLESITKTHCILLQFSIWFSLLFSQNEEIRYFFLINTIFRLLLGESDISMQKNVTLGSAVKIELSCRLADKYSSMKIIQVTWKRGNETIKHISKSKNSWAIQ